MPPVPPMEILAILGIFAGLVVFVITAVLLGVVALFDEVVLRRKKNPTTRRPLEEK